MALTDLGFDRPTYNEILEEQSNRAKTLFGETIDTSELSALGKYIRINATDIDTLYQTLEGVYYARFPNTASGSSLDRLCPFVGITRNAATYARQRITITGTPFATIPMGFEVATDNQDVVFHTIDDYTIGGLGQVTTDVDCNEAGTIGNVTIGKINTIVNPSADVYSIVHSGTVNQGKDSESDEELRGRFNVSVAGMGSGTANAIKSAVMRVAAVEDCYVNENATDQTVGRCSPYSFECIVLYDGQSTTRQAIGEAIMSKKPIGIATSGANTVTAEDEAGTSHTIKFTDTIRQNVIVICEIHTNSDFPTDGTEQIKTNIINYINSLKNGESVYVSKLYTYCHITGVEYVSEVKMHKLGESVFNDSLHINYDEVARATTETVDVRIAVGS